MSKKLWNRLFVRRQWEIIARYDVIRTWDKKPIGELFVLRDQFGNIKRKKVTV